MQSVSSRIWTRVAVSISYDDKLHHGHLQIMTIESFGILKYKRITESRPEGQTQKQEIITNQLMNFTLTANQGGKMKAKRCINTWILPKSWKNVEHKGVGDTRRVLENRGDMLSLRLQWKTSKELDNNNNNNNNKSDKSLYSFFWVKTPHW